MCVSRSISDSGRLTVEGKAHPTHIAAFTTALSPGVCGMHGFHGRVACPKCSTSTAPIPLLAAHNVPKTVPCPFCGRTVQTFTSDHGTLMYGHRVASMPMAGTPWCEGGGRGTS